MRIPFTKPTLNVIVGDLNTLIDELGSLVASNLTNALLIRQRASDLQAEAENLESEAKHAGRIADRVADLLA